MNTPCTYSNYTGKVHRTQSHSAVAVPSKLLNSLQVPNQARHQWTKLCLQNLLSISRGGNYWQCKAAAGGDILGSTSDSDMGGSGAIPASKLLTAINELTKWVVSATAAVILVTRRDLDVMWCILGSIVNVIICKVLKQIIKAERPSYAAKQDHGMPSSHAQSLGYLSVYTATAILAGTLFGSSTHLIAGGVLALGVFMTWLRVACGYHTTPQVVVGYSLGTGFALLWQKWGMHQMIPFAQQHAWMAQIVFALGTLGAVGFAAKSLAGAKADVQRFKQLAL